MTLEEQKIKEVRTGGLTDTAYADQFQGTADPNNSILTTESLKTSNPIDYKTADEAPVYPVAGLDSTPPLVATPQENKQSDPITRIMAAQNSLLGESAYRAEQENAQGIAEKNKTLTDLSSQLKAIQNEAQSIPLQMQQEATGRGITAGGLAPLQTARLRTNAIQALGVSSLLEASRGNLTTALSLVDRAVAQKFDPEREKLTALKANLEMVKNDPLTSLQDKNRAQAQLDSVNAKEKLRAEEEANEKAIATTATEAANNGADALTLKKISEAKTPMEAVLLAGQYVRQQGATALDDKMTLAGYKYVSTPAERDSLKKQGYEITTLNGRTYAKAPEPVKIIKTSGGGGGTKVTKAQAQGKSGWTKEMADKNYKDYITAGYSPQEAVKRTQELSGFVPKTAQWDISRQFVADNAGADPQEIKSYLLENTDLTATEINSLLPKAKTTNNTNTQTP